MRRRSRGNSSSMRRDVTWGYGNFAPTTVGVGSYVAFWVLGSAAGAAALTQAAFPADSTIIRMLPRVFVSSAVLGAHQGGGVYHGLIDFDQLGSLASLPAILPDPIDGAIDWMWRCPMLFASYASGNVAYGDNWFSGTATYEDVKSMRKMGANKGLLWVTHNVSSQAVDVVMDTRVAFKLPY